MAVYLDEAPGYRRRQDKGWREYRDAGHQRQQHSRARDARDNDGEWRQTLYRVPGFAVLLGEQLVGFGVVQELLVVAVPAQLASQLESDVGDVGGAGGAVRCLHVGVWLAARAHAFQEIQYVRVVLRGAFALSNAGRQNALASVGLALRP